MVLLIYRGLAMYLGFGSNSLLKYKSTTRYILEEANMILC